MDTGLGFEYLHLSPPLQGLMASPTLGDAVFHCALCAFTPAPGGWDLTPDEVSHPHDYQIIKVLMFLVSNPPPISGLVSTQRIALQDEIRSS